MGRVVHRRARVALIPDASGRAVAFEHVDREPEGEERPSGGQPCRPRPDDAVIGSCREGCAVASKRSRNVLGHEGTVYQPRVLVIAPAGGQAVAVTDTPESAEPLSEREQAMIRFEGSWFTLDVDRHDAIRSRFSCSAEEYYLELNRVIDHPAALDFDPLVVRRLQRHRQRRRREMIEGSATGERGGQQ